MTACNHMGHNVYNCPNLGELEMNQTEIANLKLRCLEIVLRLHRDVGPLRGDAAKYAESLFDWAVYGKKPDLGKE